MAKTPDGAEADVREDLGFPPKRDDWSFDVSRGDGGWKYRFMMSEFGEPYLGTRIFMSLPERFAKIPGVVKVEQEDRESYLIDSTLSETELESELWKAFNSAAAESFGK